MIDSFTGEYRWLSNFWEAPFESMFFPKHGPIRTVEHGYQAMKTICPTEQVYLLDSFNAANAKRRGRQIVQLRKDWDKIKLEYMRILVREKFEQNPDLMEKLKATGDQELVEGNYWGDTYWGVCKGKGKNMLGKILMEVRDNG